jgi:hypothetical protein
VEYYVGKLFVKPTHAKIKRKLRNYSTFFHISSKIIDVFSNKYIYFIPDSKDLLHREVCSLLVHITAAEVSLVCSDDDRIDVSIYVD